MKKILVLGAGLVGRPIALDLAQSGAYEVHVADINKVRLSRLEKEGITTINMNIRDKEQLHAVLPFYNLVVNAVPGFMGFEVLQNCIEAGKEVVDIAFYPEDPLQLDALAKEQKVRVICDMGVAPGMSNLLTGYAAHQLDKVNAVKIYVGGLPKVRKQPWEYKAVFSPTDVLEEYTRPARVVENGKIVVKEPLTEIEVLNFEATGNLEAFNSDGLRSLMFTIKADSMVEKTLRYPGYADKIKLLAQSGFFSKEKLTFSGVSVSPFEMTSRLLFNQWKLMPGEADLTVMRIVVEGKKEDERIRYSYDLYDEYSPATGIHSMARTTGYSAAMAVRLLLEDRYRTQGITVPEYLGKEEAIVKYMLDGLADRGVVYRQKREPVETVR